MGSSPSGVWRIAVGKWLPVLSERAAGNRQKLPHLIYDHLIEIDNHRPGLATDAE